MKKKSWIVVCAAVLPLIVVVAFIEVYEEPPAEDAWLDAPAICYEGRMFYWNRVFTELPHEEGTWAMVGETEGVSRKTESQELYLHAAEIEHDHGDADGAGCDTVEIGDDAVGEIWASDECHDVLYVYLREGYHSKPWVRFTIKELRDYCLICWNDGLYAASGYHVSSAESGKVEQLPEGFEETGRILKTSVDCVPTENGAAIGVWSGMIDHAICQTNYLGRKVWEHPEDAKMIYLETYWNNQTFYIPAHLITEETVGELTIPEQFLPLPE